jgi:hypothetical protein
MQISIYDALAELDKPKPIEQLNLFNIEQPPVVSIPFNKPITIDLNKLDTKLDNEKTEAVLVFNEEIKGDKFFCTVSIFQENNNFYSEVFSKFSNGQGSSWNLARSKEKEVKFLTLESCLKHTTNFLIGLFVSLNSCPGVTKNESAEFSIVIRFLEKLCLK